MCFLLLGFIDEVRRVRLVSEVSETKEESRGVYHSSKPALEYCEC
jgi:hypothetical protein